MTKIARLVIDLEEKVTPVLKRIEQAMRTVEKAAAKAQRERKEFVKQAREMAQAELLTSQIREIQRKSGRKEK